MSNVKSLPTRANGEQAWKCEACGGTFAYSQPINFKLVTAMGLLFTDWHEKHCTKPAEKGAPDA